MTDVVLVRRSIRPGKTERLREWFAELARREDEVIATLRDEGVYTETAFVEERDDGDVLYYFMETADLDEANEAVEHSEHDIDAEHAAVLDETLEDGAQLLDPVGHFTNPDRP